MCRRGLTILCKCQFNPSVPHFLSAVFSKYPWINSRWRKIALFSFFFYFSNLDRSLFSAGVSAIKSEHRCLWARIFRDKNPKISVFEIPETSHPITKYYCVLGEISRERLFFCKRCKRQTKWNIFSFSLQLEGYIHLLHNSSPRTSEKSPQELHKVYNRSGRMWFTISFNFRKHILQF